MRTATARLSNIIKNNQILFIVFSVVLVASFAGLYIYGTQKSNSGSVTRQSARCGVSACVALNEKSAEPATLTVETGNFVQFNSADGKTHNLSLTHSGVQHHDESRYDSGDFGADEAWKVQFKEDGSYTFHDKYNQNITVSVVAYTPGKDYKIK